MPIVFLPGLTATHRLFDMQVEYFSGKYNIVTWDAPGYGESRPFISDFSLMDKAEWLHMILEIELDLPYRINCPAIMLCGEKDSKNAQSVLCQMLS